MLLLTLKRNTKLDEIVFVLIKWCIKIPYII